MGYIPKTTDKYKKDYSRSIKRGWEMGLLNEVVGEICRGEKLEGKGDHPLAGKWKGCRDCHIKGDWVLIYQIEDGYVILRRAGSHSDVF